MKLRISVLFFFCVFSVLVLVSTKISYALAQDAQRVSTSLSGRSIYQLESIWTDQDGRKLRLPILQGHPVVAAMLYTSCQGACPLTVRDMKKLEHALSTSQRARVRFAIFSFDSKRDTPAKLKEFAKIHDLDLSRWTLLTGSDPDVRLLAATLGVRYKKDTNGNFSHSNVITVLDSKGVIQHQQTGLGADPTESVRTIEGLVQ